MKIAFRNFRFSQLFAGLITEARGVGEKLTAARRMKGVVSPQAIPTRRKPSVERKIEGGDASIDRKNGYLYFDRIERCFILGKSCGGHVVQGKHQPLSAIAMAVLAKLVEPTLEHSRTTTPSRIQ